MKTDVIKIAAELLFIGLSLSLCGCAGMNAQQIKSAMEECQAYDLGVLVYQRVEGAVMAVRCMPKKAMVDQTVIMRRRASSQLLRPVLYEYTIQ